MENNTGEIVLGIEKVKQDIKLLEQTEGWVNLTERQRKMISMSLYVQARAERKTDPLSAKAYFLSTDRGRPVTHIDTADTLTELNILGVPEDLRKYRTSQEFVARTYCHYAIKSLETGKMADPQEYDYPEDFFSLDVQHNTADHRIEDRIDEIGYPCVLQVSRGETEMARIFNRLHSCLVMGRVDGKYIVWEKVNGNEPYTVTTLDVVKAQFNQPENYWGIRKLKKDQD